MFISACSHVSSCPNLYQVLSSYSQKHVTFDIKWERKGSLLHMHNPLKTACHLRSTATCKRNYSEITGSAYAYKWKDRSLFSGKGHGMFCNHITILSSSQSILPHLHCPVDINPGPCQLQHHTWVQQEKPWLPWAETITESMLTIILFSY